MYTKEQIESIRKAAIDGFLRSCRVNESEWIDKLDLNPYIEIELKRNGIYTIEELNAKSNHELCAYPGLRLPHVNEIIEKLNGYYFGDEVE